MDDRIRPYRTAHPIYCSGDGRNRERSKTSGHSRNRFQVSGLEAPYEYRERGQAEFELAPVSATLLSATSTQGTLRSVNPHASQARPAHVVPCPTQVILERK